MLLGLVQLSIKRTFWYSVPTWHNHGEFLPPVHALKWWRLGALMPRWHPVAVATISCVIPHQSVLEGNKNYLNSSAHMEHHNTTVLSPEPVPDLHCDVLQSLHCLGFLFILNWLILHCIAIEKKILCFAPFYTGQTCLIHLLLQCWIGYWKSHSRKIVWPVLKDFLWWRCHSVPKSFATLIIWKVLLMAQSSLLQLNPSPFSDVSHRHAERTIPSCSAAGFHAYKDCWTSPSAVSFLAQTVLFIQFVPIPSLFWWFSLLSSDLFLCRPYLLGNQCPKLNTGLPLGLIQGEQNKIYLRSYT